MQKKRTTKRVVKNRKIKNEIPAIIKNYGPLQTLLGYGSGLGSDPLNQVEPLFQANRWYMLSNIRQLLSELYVENGIVQTLVNVPVDDALRGGVEIITKQLEASQIEYLIIYMERENDFLNLGQGHKWNRLFGGGGLVTMCPQNPATPLNIKALYKSNLKFRDADLWELFYDKQNINGEFDEGFSPEAWDAETEMYSYYGRPLHKSRVIKLVGMRAPSFVRPRLRGWGFSVLESVVRSLNQFLKATNLTYEVLDEFKVDYYKIKNLANALLSPNGSNAIDSRISDANRTKNFQNAVVMDAEDDFLQKQLSFTGIAEVMQSVRMQIASDLRMPLTKVFGISAAGFSSGEDDIENYNAMVESSVRSPMKWDILKMIELRCQQLFDFIPDDLSIRFKPLRVLSSEQEENVKTQKFTRALQAAQAGAITQEQFIDVCNKENLLGIQLEKNEIEPDDWMTQGDGADDADQKSLSASPAPKSTIEAPEAKE